jgi:3-oxoacyl-[acyl-carrier-protein] synthase II
MSAREVVITGIGLYTPLGNNIETNWGNLKAGQTGLSTISREDGQSQERGLPNFLLYKGKVLQLDIPENIPPKLYNQMKFLNRGSLLGFCAAHEAVSKSGVDLQDTQPDRRALYIASGDFTNVGYDFMYPAIKDGTGGTWRNIDTEKLNTATLDKVNPFFLLESIHNNLFSFLSAFFEFMGPNTSMASLSPCGGQALELAYRSIQCDKADIALAVGCGSWINEISLYELEGLGILSKCASGIQSFSPFDKNRDGFIPGEGGAVIVLEASDIAARRGATILGKIRGFGNCTEFSSDGGWSLPRKVVKRGILQAMEDAGCSMQDLSFIVLHGSGTQKGDRSELKSVVDIIEDRKSSLPICGMKPYTGHMGAASDIAEVIFGLKAAAENMVPATLNFCKSDEEFTDLNISNTHLTCEKDLFMSVSYGIGGHSSSVVIEAK